MRRLPGVLIVSALTTIATSGAALAGDASGFVSLGGGLHVIDVAYDSGGETLNGFAVEGAASGVYTFTPVLGIQGDVVLASQRMNSLTDGDSSDTMSVDAAVHAFYREPERFLLGGFVQLGRDDTAYSYDYEWTQSCTFVGGEAQLFLDNLTLYGQGGFQKVAIEDSSNHQTGWFGTVEARYFLTPDFRIEAHGGVSVLAYENDDDSTKTVWNFGVGAEYRLANSPISLFAKYDFLNGTAEYASDLSINEHRVMVGAKFSFGDDTLLDRDRTGPSLKPAQSTLMFGGPA